MALGEIGEDNLVRVSRIPGCNEDKVVTFDIGMAHWPQPERGELYLSFLFTDC